MPLELRIHTVRLLDNLYTADLGTRIEVIYSTQQQFAALSGTRATARVLV